ncbi:MAG: BadF/BadG/BcrA/BcrD ATPase family protein [Bilophila wadsworthia]
MELGGEDAKILYLSQGMDLRMNEACAGGTGAFIDQMAALLHTDASGLNELAANYTTLYPIASRCGVFAKTDVVPLLNEGAAREDLAASIFQAVVEQTIGGLACGNPIRGKVAFLGGPLHFLPELRKRFIATLKLAPEEVVPFPNAQYMVALGTALSLVDLPGAARMADMEPVTLGTLAERARVRGDAGIGRPPSLRCSTTKPTTICSANATTGTPPRASRWNPRPARSSSAWTSAQRRSRPCLPMPTALS